MLTAARPTNNTSFHFILSLWEWERWLKWSLLRAAGPKRLTKIKFIWFLMERGEQWEGGSVFFLGGGYGRSSAKATSRKERLAPPVNESLLFSIWEWRMNDQIEKKDRGRSTRTNKGRERGGGWAVFLWGLWGGAHLRRMDSIPQTHSFRLFHFTCSALIH